MINRISTYLWIWAGLCALLCMSSCESLSDAGENPNSVQQTPPHLLLTEIESTAFQTVGQSPLFASRMLTRTSGEDPLQYYKWNRDTYEEFNVLRDVIKMQEEAARRGEPVYDALGKFFRAFYFYKLTLTFGDVPFSEALQGESDQIFQPVYDPQEEVFAGILSLLEEANDGLAANGTATIEGDIVHGGNVDNWRRLVNSFRLKVLLTLSNKQGDTSINVAEAFQTIAANEPIITSRAQNGQLTFVDQLGSRYGEFNDSDYGSDIYADSSLVARLQERNDPRLFIYFRPTSEASNSGLGVDDVDAYGGVYPVGAYGDFDAARVSIVNPRYYNDPVNEPHVVLGYSETQFMLAEAAVRGWITGDAASYYENGVRANFSFYNEYAEQYSQYINGDDIATDYLAQPGVQFSSASGMDDRLQLISMQRYLRSYMQGGWSVFFQKLRTGYPTFLEPANSPIPYRWLYPLSEVNNNEENLNAAIQRQFGSRGDAIRAMPWWLQ